MGVTLTSNPQPAEGEWVGRPIRIPYILFCTNGERWCGWQRTANSRRQFLDLAADRRRHETVCKGGLIAATVMPSVNNLRKGTMMG